MTRIGFNPGRNRLSEYRPARLTVATITCIPNLEGYFRQRLDVLRLSLASLLKNTPQPYDLLVFDNGSCPAVVDLLRGLCDAGSIRFLFLSRENIGKIGAFQFLFRAAPGELVAYSDDDIFFYPGWLEATLRLLEVYPQAGMISSLPVRNGSRYAIGAILRLMEAGAPGTSITRNRRIPDEWEADWALSTGRDPEAARLALIDHQELVLCKEGVEAIGAANHFQFLSPKQVILDALPNDWSGRLMGQMIELDEAVDNAGYLRLSTVERYSRHIGNILSPTLLEEAQCLGIETGTIEAKGITRRRSWLTRIPGIRRLFVTIYNRLFNILNEIQ
jgi:glycosyltransferase involved in cell wall biosynthesis